VDGPSLDAGNPFRQFDVGTRVYNAGSSSAVQVPGGVFPGLGAMGVTGASGLSVQVAAGYCCVPASVTNQGGYLFGTLTAATLTLAAADPAYARIDLVVARVYDTGTSSGYCDVEVVTGTAASPASAPSVPANAIALASVSIPAGAVALASGAITDLRTWVVAPGGVLPIASAAAAPAAPSSQIMMDMSRNLLVQGTGTAGSVALLNTGAWNPALAYGTSAVSDSSAKGSLKQILSVNVTTDGETDIEVYIKWPGLYVSVAPLIVAMTISVDGTVVDQTPIYAQSSSSSAPGNGGSTRWYSSSALGTTPSAATHTISFGFRSASATATTTMACSSNALACLRVAPAVA
jgi:hypothetical protein